MAHNESFMQLTPPEQRQLERIVEQFEKAWGRGENPAIESHLPADPSLRRAVVVELAHSDLEFRRNGGQVIVPSEYLSRFPELGTDPEFMRSLLSQQQVLHAGEDDSKRVTAAPGTRTATWSSFMPGKDLGSYTILEIIGAGGAGIVFKAEHRRMKRIVAIKMLRPSAMERPEMVKRFHREVETMAKLAHPNIVVAHDADEIDGGHILVMEYVDGVDLHRQVQQHGPLSVEKAVNAVLQAAAGLEYAHRQGIIHRDIKPANLLLDKQGTVKILDMGLARLQKMMNSAEPVEEVSALTDLGTVIGTVDFMAPEQVVDSSQVGITSDVYSLGATLYYLLTGKPPYSGATPMMRIIAHRQAPIPSLRAVRPDVPPQIDTILQRMLAKKKEARYQSMAKLIGELVHWPSMVP